MYGENGTCFTSKTSVHGPGWKGTPYHLLHIYVLPPDDGLKMGPKHVEVW
jgi:hypothetical protein